MPILILTSVKCSFRYWQNAVHATANTVGRSTIVTFKLVKLGAACLTWKALQEVTMISCWSIPNHLQRKKAGTMKNRGFIKSTDHRPTDHRPTDPPTQLSYLKDLITERLSFYRTLTQLRKLFRFIFYCLMNNICLHNFEYLQKKTWLLIK